MDVCGTKFQNAVVPLASRLNESIFVIIVKSESVKIDYSCCSKRRKMLKKLAWFEAFWAGFAILS